VLVEGAKIFWGGAEGRGGTRIQSVFAGKKKKGLHDRWNYEGRGMKGKKLANLHMEQGLAPVGGN